ncbi:MAG: YwbE family protein [candidate division WWE3 bacterium]|nr:YwbE family protein [candidate division WWE3 bacterium]
MTQQNSEVPARSEIKIGQRVWAIEKRNYESGELAEGVVKRILTSAPHHPRGIKVIFEDGTIARVQRLIPEGDMVRQRLTPPKSISPKAEPSVDLDAEGELR